jgi:nicotinamidase-related amidase
VTAAVSNDPGLVDLVGPLAALAHTEQTLDKPTYSMFGVVGLAEILAARGADTLILTGVETDVCVLATLFDAVDRGYRVVVVADAVTSSSAEGHEAVLEHVLTRLPQ